MADDSVQALGCNPHPRLSFLGVPAEIRLKIYKFVLPEISIRCERRRPTALNPDWTSATCEITPGIHLLLISRQVYAEAKSVFDSAPVAVITEHYLHPTIPLDFPQPALQRIYKLTIEGLDPYFGGFTFLFGEGWFDRNLCPNVRILLREMPKIPPASYSGFRFSTDEGPLRFIPLLLPGSPIRPRGYRTANKDAHNLFEICKSRVRSGGNHCAVNWLDRSNYFIKYYDLIVETTYKVGFRAKTEEGTNCMGPWIIFETWLDVDVIWDKNGIRIDGLPDLRRFVWWKEWADTCQLPPSQRPVILETCTEYPEREFARDRPWNVVNTNSEACVRENSVSNNTETTATQSADTSS